ncbi:glutamine amidotransferase [Azospirillum picis]|uniref:GMP synthase (Glutamine-hydrolyzing) n=1 Tax=Azospirillum picis TaxID=488438 RepID=A0ABU0MPV0_9PROT|nr:glutamine amidotransferase [Azospirillum picis]MBP2301372.1 GMP synthase (glutamine-hydrolyzing) [Azospirillum picis]MDQ0535203.1 GMP synthase (glutamine-hydrolyzing) [Azospirillum picis]
MTPTAIAIRHIAFEGLGIVEPILRRAGYALHVHDAGIDDLQGIDPSDAQLLVVLGGPVGAYEDDRYPFLADELRLLERRLAAGLPTLGICLGAQLMARALGARVYPGPGKEIGWAPLALTEAGRASPLAHLDGAAVLHWHGDTFDLPAGAELLASTDLCAHQAFSLGRNALGLQFHGEVDGADIERWLVGHACEIAAAGLDPRQLRADSKRHGPVLRDAGSRLFADWIAGLGQR